MKLLEEQTAHIAIVMLPSVDHDLTDRTFRFGARRLQPNDSAYGCSFYELGSRAHYGYDFDHNSTAQGPPPGDIVSAGVPIDEAS
jgi:hypothetical protein